MNLDRVQNLPQLPPRKPDGHKGDFGTVLVIAGGRGMAGAAALVGAGALRSGAGRVRIACPWEVQPTVAQYEPSYMAHPLPDDGDGHIDFPACQEDLLKLMTGATSIAIGPGIGQSESLAGLVAWLLEQASQPLVLDADALNNLVGKTALLESRSAPLILTPHPGEFSRLTGRAITEVQENRESLAVEFASKHRIILVLKGASTIVTDGERIYVNTGSGNPGMATGGSGDILGGMVAALLGQGLSPFEAAQLGVYVHGLAGDIARDQNGMVGMIAGDIVDALPDAFYHMSSLSSGQE